MGFIKDNSPKQNVYVNKLRQQFYRLTLLWPYFCTRLAEKENTRTWTCRQLQSKKWGVDAKLGGLSEWKQADWLIMYFCNTVSTDGPERLNSEITEYSKAETFRAASSAAQRGMYHNCSLPSQTKEGTLPPSCPLSLGSLQQIVSTCKVLKEAKWAQQRLRLWSSNSYLQSEVF